MTDADFFSGLVGELAELARLHRLRCEKRGYSVVFTSGYRNATQQLELYGHGREHTADGWRVVDHAKIVTYALPDEAPHCRGAAYDLAPLFKEKIDWKRIDLFLAVAEFMPEGLTWAGTWRGRLCDYGHYELTHWRQLQLRAA